MTNVDPRLSSFRDRARNVRDEKKQAAALERDLKAEMKGAGLSKSDIAGIYMSLKVEEMDQDKRQDYEAACAVADMLAGSGAPLFEAAH